MGRLVYRRPMVAQITNSIELGHKEKNTSKHLSR